jgi:O-glycosyl hydrolase
VNDNADPFVINNAGFDFGRPFQFAVNEPLIDPVAEYQQVILPFKARVESRGEPFSTYVSPIYDHGSFPAHWHDPEEYAEFAEAYHAWAKVKFNFTPGYWVIVNEPDAPFFGAGRELERDVIAVGARLKARGYSTRIQAVETISPHAGQMQSVLANPAARQYVGLLSFHSYDYRTGRVPRFGRRNVIRELARQYGLRTAMTEVCCKGAWNGSYAHALGWARDIYWNLTEADASVWEPLSLAFTCSTAGCSSGGGSPIMIDTDHSRYFKLAAYFGLRQFSHHIRPGYQRLGVTCSRCTSSSSVGQNLKPVAFEGPSGKMVVVVVNDQPSAQNIGLAGLPAGAYDITGVSPGATSGMIFPPVVIAPGQTLPFTLPAQAIVTFVKR